MSDVIQSQMDAIRDAVAFGLRVVRGTPTLILLDLDTVYDKLWFEYMYPIVKMELRRNDIKIWVAKHWQSKSLKGWHYKLRCSPELPLEVRLLLQACLGSDRKKEFLSYIRSLNGTREPSLLFRPPEVQPLPENKNFGTAFDDDVPF